MSHSHPSEAILIRAGRVIDPASGLDRVTDVALRDGLVAEIGDGLSPSPADRVIDAEGLLVTPGLIDPHVHLREPGQTHKEDIASGTRAAVAGGFTTVCCMPNTAPAIDSPGVVRQILKRADETASCRVFPVSCATKARLGETMAPIGLCAKAGSVGISDDGDVVASPRMMRDVLEATRAAGLAFMQHAQETTLTQGAAMHEGAVAARLGLTGWTRVAEEIIVERDVQLSEETGCDYHVQHVSSGGTVEILRQARARGLPVSGEASPHHLHLTHEACEQGGGFNTAAKMNPPLREQSDVDALRQGVADGTITILATDHAPHTRAEKTRPFAEAPFGIIGLECALALYAEALVHTGAIDWPKLIELMTLNPARLCRLDRLGLGSLSVGGPADVTLIDPDLAWTLTESELAGKSSNTPFLGRALTGRAVGVIVGGRVRAERRSDVTQH
ncbi:MAG: dihydroorotase [Phycisphaerales bacterium JB040]